MSEQSAKPLEEPRVTPSELAGAFEYAPVGMAITNNDARIVYANRALAQMLGYGPEEILGKSVADLTYPDDLAESLANIRRLGRDEITHFSIEKRYVHKSGNIVWARTYVSGVSHSARDHYILHVADMTHEKAAGETLRETQQRFREMADAIDQDFWMMSIEPLKLLYSSPAGARIWGFDPMANREHPGDIIARVHPEDLNAFGELFGSLLTEGREREYRIVRPDGTVRWARSRVFPVRDAGGTVYRIAGVTEDVTARKHAEQEVERHRAFERLVLKLSTELVNVPADRINEGFEMALGELGVAIGADRGGILLVDEHGETATMRYRWRAPGFGTPDVFATFEFAPSTLMRQSLMRDGVLTVDSVEAMPDAVGDVREKLKANGVGAFIDVPLIVRGELIGVLAFGTVGRPLAWPPDVAALLKIAGEMFSNAIERVRSEEAIRTHRDSLAHVLRVGTMGQLASGIAHELNQPLSAILSYAHGCERRLTAGDLNVAHQQQAVRKIAEQAVRAAEVIKTLRTLVRKGEGRRSWHDPNELVRAALGFIETEIADESIRLEADLGQSLPSVQVDPIQIEQVVLNLVRNAVEAAQPGRNGARPEIRVTTRLGEADRIEICVADNGPGIDARHANFIFDEFYTTKPEGLGLGLSISRSIIEAHGGELWLEDGRREGVAFRFTLPAAY